MEKSFIPSQYLCSRCTGLRETQLVLVHKVNEAQVSNFGCPVETIQHSLTSRQ